jgi:hypothetical protein
MPRMKFGLILAGLVAMLATSATPAFALFESESGKLSGAVEILKAGEFVYETGANVKCPPKSPTITWNLPAEKSEKQIYKVSWGTECTALIGGSVIAATISPSELEVKSPESGKGTYTELKGTNLLTTEIKTATCTIIVPAEGNKELKKTEQSNLTEPVFSELVKVNTTGVKANKSKNALCPLLEKSEKAELKEVELRARGQKQT